MAELRIKADMKINTLVTHMKHPELGIGCVSKKLKASVKVVFDEGRVVDCKPTVLREVDVEGAPDPIPFEDFATSYQQSPPVETVVLAHEVHRFTNSGWMAFEHVTLEDLKKYPRII